MSARPRFLLPYVALVFIPALHGANAPLPPGAIAHLGGRPFQHLAPVRGLAFLPEGKTIVAAAGNSLHYWDVEKAALTRAVKVHANPIQKMAISADGKTAILNVGANEPGILWDLQKDKEIRRLDESKNPRKLAFADGDKTVVAFAEWKLCVWDAATGRRKKLDPEPPGGVLGLAVSPSGGIVALIYKDVITLWDYARHAEVSRINRRDRANTPVVFSPDGKSLLIVENLLYERWQVATGKLQATKPVEVNGTTSAVYLDNETVFLAGPNDWIVHLTFDGGNANLIQVGPCNDRRLLAMSKDGKRAVTFTRDSRTLLVFDTKTGTPVHNTDGHPQMVTQLALSADGKYMISGVDPQQFEDGAPRVWDLATNRQLPDLDRNRSYPSAFSVAPNGTIAVANSEETIQRWPVTGGARLKPLPNRQGDFPVQVAYSPDGKALAIGYESGFVDIVDPESGKPLPRDFIKVPNYVQRLVWSPDGRFLAVGNAQGSTLWLYHAATGRQRRVFTHSLFPKRAMGAFVFSPDGRTLAVTNRRNLVALFDVNTGETRLTISGLTTAKALAFAPDGRTLLVGSADNSIRFLDVHTGEERSRLTGNNGGIDSLLVFPDGKQFASGCGDGTIVLWDMTRNLPSRRERRILTESEQTSIASLLRKSDNETAWQVIGRLSDADSATLARVLSTHLKPAAPPDDIEVRRWIADLDNNNFRVRDRAAKALEKLGPLARTPLKQALDKKPSGETVERLERLLRRLADDTPPPSQNFAFRAIEALERNGGKEARTELERIAAGASDAFITVEARNSLERMKRVRP